MNCIICGSGDAPYACRTVLELPTTKLGYRQRRVLQSAHYCRAHKDQAEQGKNITVVCPACGQDKLRQLGDESLEFKEPLWPIKDLECAVCGWKGDAHEVS